jgi:tripartite-type tricarboxylate transporter receptor subunit TctC
LAESGRSDLTAETFFGVLAPTGTPQTIIETLNEAMKNAATNAEYVAALEKVGLKPTSSTPEQFGALLNRHQRRWIDLIKARNIVAE